MPVSGEVLKYHHGSYKWLCFEQEQVCLFTVAHLQCMHTHTCMHTYSFHAYVYHHSHRPVSSEVGLFETCLAYLNSLLKVLPRAVEEGTRPIVLNFYLAPPPQTYTETAEVFSETHVERLFLFSVIWSYGGILSNEKDQLKFSALLKSLTNR